MAERASVAVKLNTTVEELRRAAGNGALRLIDGGVVSTVKFLVSDMPWLPAESVQLASQVWAPSDNPVACQLVNVPLETDAFDMLVVLSRTNEQVRLVARLSVAVKLRFTVVTLKNVLLLGLFRVTVGAVVSTVKFLVWLIPELPDESVQLVIQV